MKKLITTCVVVGLTIFTTSAAYAALPSDNFDDNSMNTSMWILYQEDPVKVWMEETNQRLEIHSTGAAGDVSANYVANWGLATAEDFSFKADFHVSSLSGGGMPYQLNARIGLCKFGDIVTGVKNTSMAGADYYVDGSEIHENFDGDKTTNGIHVYEGGKPRSLDDGTLYISYDAAADELYMSDTGYWAANAFVTIPALLKGEWGAGVVRPVLAGDAENIAMVSGDAYLDNFVVDSGTIVPICMYAIAGDLNNDCRVDFLDFAIMASNWLIDCDVTPGDPACVPK